MIRRCGSTVTTYRALSIFRLGMAAMLAQGPEGTPRLPILDVACRLLEHGRGWLPGGVRTRVLRQAVVGAHGGCSGSHRLHGPRRIGRRGGRHRAAGAARLAAGARAGRRFAGGADAGAPPHRGRPGRPQRARLRADDGGPSHRGHRAAAPAADPVRARGGARPRALRPRPHRRGHALAGGGRAAARGLLRSVSAAALRLRAHAGADLRLRGVPRPARGAGVPDHGAGDAAGPDPVASLGQQGQPRPQPGLWRVRRRVSRRPAGTGHAEGLRPER